MDVAPCTLTRKWILSGARGSGPWPSGLVRVCGVWSGGLSLAWFAGFGVADAGEGDFEAEGAEFADVVGDLAADVGLAVVEVDAEGGVAHAGVGEQLVVDLTMGV